MVSEKLGPYKLGKILGRGGMGSVYEGTSEQDGSVVAIKILADFIDEDEYAEVRLRFESEIETLKRLRHPNIVRLSGFGEEKGQLYYVMEYVNGSSLLQELRKKRIFQWHEAAKVGLDICQALRHAHDRGVIHRDIKPANILLDQEGNVKLSDFGIARFFGAQQITDIHSIIGTLEYMSPEQASAQPITSTADIYSLGCVLFVLLTGKPPFTARSLPEILRLYRTTSPISIRSLRHDVPENLEYLITDMLKIQPEERPRTVHLVIKRLQSLLQALMGNADSIKVKPMKSETAMRYHETVFSSAANGAPNVVSSNEVPLAPASVDSSSEQDLIDKSLSETVSASSVWGIPQQQPVEHSSFKPPKHGNVMLSNTHTLRPGKDEPIDEAGYWSDSIRISQSDSKPNASAVSDPVPQLPGQNISSADQVHKTTAKSVHSGTRFVAVADQNLDPFEDDHRDPPTAISLPIAVTSTLLLILGLSVYYLIQPASPEVLFERIVNTIKEDEVSGEFSPSLLRSAADDIRDFLNLYPNHPSAAQIRYYQEELDLLEHERRLERRTQFSGVRSLSPVERAYVEVLTSSPNDTEQMIIKLHAFINVFQTTIPTEEKTQKQRSRISNPVEVCVELAQRRLKKLELSLEEINTEQVQVVRRRLEEAAALDLADPLRADNIRQGIIELYKNHHWAHDIVEEAKQKLTSK